MMFLTPLLPRNKRCCDVPCGHLFTDHTIDGRCMVVDCTCHGYLVSHRSKHGTFARGAHIPMMALLTHDRIVCGRCNGDVTLVALPSSGDSSRIVWVHDYPTIPECPSTQTES